MSVPISSPSRALRRKEQRLAALRGFAYSHKSACGATARLRSSSDVERLIDHFGIVTEVRKGTVVTAGS